MWGSVSNNDKCSIEDAKKLCLLYGENIKKQHQMNFPVEPLDAQASEFFKNLYVNTPRTIRKTI